MKLIGALPFLFFKNSNLKEIMSLKFNRMFHISVGSSPDLADGYYEVKLI
jgi:hypothetical protein